MTTPVVAPRSGFYPPNLRGGTLEVKKNDVIPDIISRKRKENVRNLRRQAGHPTGVAAALSRSDCTGGERRRGNLFLSSDSFGGDFVL